MTAINKGDQKSELIQTIGRILTTDLEMDGDDWDGLSYVISAGDAGSGRMHGYAFRGKSDFEPVLPGERPSRTLKVFTALRDEMADETGDVWKQALVHIVKPGPQIKMQFEYDSPDRWKPEIKGLDMTDYAMSIRPEMP